MKPCFRLTQARAMPVILRTTRMLGGAVALWLLWHLSPFPFSWLRDYGFSMDFLWTQILPVYIPYMALLLLLLVPFSRIRRASAWTSLFIAMAVLSLVWFVPVAYRAVAHPTISVEKPPGEGVPPMIIIKRSYDELPIVGLISGFLLTQILAIWIQRQRASTPVIL